MKVNSISDLNKVQSYLNMYGFWLRVDEWFPGNKSFTLVKDNHFVMPSEGNNLEGLVEILEYFERHEKAKLVRNK